MPAGRIARFGLLIALASAFAVPVTQAQVPSNEELARRSLERRAVEAVIWGMPIVNYDLMFQAAIRQARIGFNEVVYWSRLLDWKNQTLTPNPDSIYFMPFINTKEVGPMVIEIPPADSGVINGTIMNVWQVPLEDVGPAGVDKGKGGKYLVLPPDYKQKPPPGYIVLPSDTWRGYALLRSIVKSDSAADVAKAVEYGRRIKVYPLSQAAKPPPTKFADAVDSVFEATIPYDARFFQALDRQVQAEPWLVRDKVMIDQLKSIGIERGKPFIANENNRPALDAAAREAGAWLEMKYEEAMATGYFDEASRWSMPASPEYLASATSNYTRPDSYPVDDRGLVFSFAFFTLKHVGAGQYYLMSIKDALGQDFDGAKTYRLTVPPKAPVKQYWSATAYDRETHALIREVPRASRSSQNAALQKNADGSVDLWFGPAAPEGKESNWVPTRAGSRFEVLFRFYGPEQALFDKTWKLPDIEEAK
jgi:hypothetical protein